MKNKNIHVIYIITKLELGGAQKVCLSLFKGLQKRGCCSHLISGTQGPLVTEVDNNSHVYLLDTMQREVTIAACLQEIKNFFHLIKTLRSLRKKYPHIMVHTHSTKAGIVGRWAAVAARIPRRIHTIHGYGFHEYQSIFSWLFIYLCEFITSFITTHFICVSAHDAKTGIRLLPRFRENHSIIRAAVDATQFYQPARQQEASSLATPFVFGTIACFKPQKNLIDLVQAFALVHAQLPSTRLEIIGDGVERPLLQAWIDRHSLTNAVTLHGWQRTVAPVMEQWHAFVLSSLWEGLPCAVVEARLLQLPVISYSVGGISEIITHEHNGLLCAPKDIAALAANMKRVVLEKSLYSRMHNYADYLEDFNTTQMIEDHVTLYKQLLTPSIKNSFFL